MSKNWIVKDVLDHVHGPYETEEILSQIENGTLTGDEFISSYPEGTWKQISSEPEFFDYMLAALTGLPFPKREGSVGDGIGKADLTVDLDQKEISVTEDNTKKKHQG